MNYKIVTNTVVEAGSAEEAVSKLASHFSTVARHLGNGEALESCDPCFTLTENAKGEAVPLLDPFTEAIKQAKLAESAPPAEPVETEPKVDA